MNSEPAERDDHVDADEQIGRLLREQYATAPLPESLWQRLLQERQQVWQELTDDRQLTADHNGLEPVAPYLSANMQRRRWWRAGAMVATAAALFIGAAWLHRPDSSWASVIDALWTRVWDRVRSAPAQSRERETDIDRPLGSAPQATSSPTYDRVPPAPPPRPLPPPSPASHRPPQAGALPSIPAEPPPWIDAPPLPLHEVRDQIDLRLAEHWRTSGIESTFAATDDEFVRRIYLDLVGRIPTVYELRAFWTHRERATLADQLLQSPEHALHWGSVWRGVLVPATANVDSIGGTEKFEDWLSEQIAQNRSYADWIREMLLVDGRVNEAGPVLFFAANKLEPEAIAAQVTRALLGIRLECAQCHDHPFNDWKQEDFWGVAAYFAQLGRPQGKLEMMSPVLRVKDEEIGEVQLPGSGTVVAERFPWSVARAQDESVSRRHRFVAWLTARDNLQFARTAVNRLWAHLFGRGLVEPVDDFGDNNRPVIPELLDDLTRSFIQSNYDLRRLLHTLISTKAYQLSSAADDDDPVRGLTFAQMNIKPLTAAQLYDCIHVATLRAISAEDLRASDTLVDRDADGGRAQFVRQFATSGGLTDYHAGIPQALTLMNGRLIGDATGLRSSDLLKSLSAPFFTDEQRIETLFMATVSRGPTEQEMRWMTASLSTAGDDRQRQEILADLLWSLLNSAEFTLNH